jgi:hypothetical protein
LGSALDSFIPSDRSINVLLPGLISYYFCIVGKRKQALTKENIMSQTTINQLPLIVADEKEAMLNSIVNLLRQRGFVVVVEKQMPQVQPQTEIKEMDALSILRFVDEAWQQEIPVVILTQQPATVAPTYRLAA